MLRPHHDQALPTVTATPGQTFAIDRAGCRSVHRTADDFEAIRRVLQTRYDFREPILSAGSGAAVGMQAWLQKALTSPLTRSSPELRRFLEPDSADSEDDIDADLDDALGNLSVDEDLDKEIKQSLSVPTVPASLDDFQLLKVIGKGAFGKVMLVRSKSDPKQLFALKQLDKSKVRNKGQSEHAMTERNILEYIRHPFIVTMRGAFQTESKLFIVLDYCAGGELFFHLQRMGTFSEELARFYTAQLVLAIEYLHELGIVFRDLKLENVLLDAKGNIQLTDFGLSKEGVADNVSARSFCGTPEYLAPEVLTGTGYGRAADWWSLGTLLFEMLTGLPPFYAKDSKQLFQRILTSRLRLPYHVSPEAGDLLQRLLSRNVESRIGSSDDDAREIKQHCFFAGIDWDLLLAKEVPPPFNPCDGLAPDDTSNFDIDFTNLPVASTDLASGSFVKDVDPDLSNSLSDFPFPLNPASGQR
ncbi:Non-specific serine/threonine protein kinase [Plasmodiophora brassicae]